ncbi:MAG: cell division protein FtsA [Holosporaceae bacterium]
MTRRFNRLHVMPIAVLDVGTTKTACWVVRAQENGGFSVIGSAYQESRGFKAGCVSDLGALVKRLSDVVHKAETAAKERVRYAVMSIGGTFLKGQLKRASVPLLGNYVTKEDIARLKADAQVHSHPKENHILHVLPQGYTLDGQGGIDHPEGMLGRTLEGTFYVISVAKQHVQNLLMAIQKAHLEVLYAVASPYAAALSCLTEDERQLGAVVLDIGGGGVSLSGYKEGAFAFMDYVPLGSMHVTKDLAYGLELETAIAERVKILQGSCIRGGGASNMSFLRRQDAALQHQALSDERLYDIIFPRVDEILTLVKQKLDQTSYFKVPTLRFVLAGGGSQLAGLKEASQNFFGCPVRLAETKMPEGAPEARTDFATIAGMVIDMVVREKQSLAQAFSESLKTKSFFRQITSWFKENL